MSCGCVKLKDGSVELCSHHQYVHDHGGRVICIRCLEPRLGDDVYLGVCLQCRTAAMLERCGSCGRLVPRSACVMDKMIPYCPTCHKEMTR